MAEDEVQEAEDGAEGAAEGEEGEPAKSKGPIKLLGGVVGLIAAGVVLAVMAVPKKEPVRRLEGPSLHVFFPDTQMTGNTLDDNYGRYAKFSPSASFMAYDVTYADARREDPQYERRLKGAMQFTLSRYRLDEIMSPTDNEAFAAVLEEVAEPLLFPVHLGMTSFPYEQDPDSGLRFGESHEKESTFRGLFFEHVLKVDAVKKTLQMGEGPVAEFTGDEYDVLVEAEDGTKIYVDVTGITEGFVGEVNVGVMGRIRQLFTGEIIAQ